jgi:hypothetical protein
MKVSAMKERMILIAQEPALRRSMESMAEEVLLSMGMRLRSNVTF